jgi:hypothetical protein
MVSSQRRSFAKKVAAHERHRPGVVGLLVVMGFFWSGWFLWAFLVLIFGVRPPAPLNDLSPMGLRRTLVGIGVLVLFVLTFTPIPFSQIS